MPVTAHDDDCASIEQFAPSCAKEDQETLARRAVFHDVGLRREEPATDFTRIQPDRKLEPGGRLLQGGVLAALVDEAARRALRTKLERGHEAVTIHLDTKYFRPAYETRVFAEGSVVRKGRDLAHIEVAVINDEGNLVARGWCVLKITRRLEPTPCEASGGPGA